MDDISLIGHMIGEGETAANKLRQAGYTTPERIVEAEPAVLAKETGLELEIINKIFNSVKAFSRTHPTPKIKTETRKKAVKTTVSAKKKVKKLKVATKKRIAKEGKKPKESPKEIIAEKPITDPWKRIVYELAEEHEIVESAVRKLVGVVTKNPAIRKKIFKEAMVRERFREKLSRKLIKGLI